MTAPVTQGEALGRAARWPLRPMLAGVVVAALLAAGIAVLLAADVSWVDRADRWANSAWVDAAQEHGWWGGLLKLVTFWGNTPVVIVVTAVMAGWQVYRRRPVLAVWVVTTLVSGWLLNHTLKRIVERDRPSTDGLVIDALGPSFPSGHAQVAGYGWVTFGLLALLVLRGRVRTAVAWACWTLGLMIAGSRVLLGVHWPTDVVAGYAVGVGWALACACLLVLGARRRPAAVGAEVTASTSG